MRIRIGFFLLLALTAASPRATADPVSETDARAAVDAWLRLDAHPLGAALEGKIAGFVPYTDAKGLTFYYVASLDPEGFIIVSADDLIDPVIAFSREGTFDPSPANPLGALVDRDLPGRVEGVRAAQAAAIRQGLAFTPSGGFANARDKWTLLRSSQPSLAALGSVSDVRVAPLTQTRWSQSTVSGKAVYNYYTPPGYGGQATNYYCGCVATAMAQFLYYVRHPVLGVGTPQFSIKVDGVRKYRTLRGGDGAGGPYQWDNMPAVPNGTVTDAQRQAIGALTYDAGVSVSMEYAADGSGATLSDVVDRFTDTFMFSNVGYAAEYNVGIQPSELAKIINTNLDDGLPVILGILDTGSLYGHAVVADGYGFNFSTLYHHVNMGWSGLDDAWYALPSIDASTPYNTVSGCVYNVYKSGSGEIVSGRVLDTSGAPIAGVTVTATQAGGGSWATVTNANGIYALEKLPSATSFTVTASMTYYTFSPPQSVTTGTSIYKRSYTGNVWGINFTRTGLSVPLASFGSAASSHPENITVVQIPVTLSMSPTTAATVNYTVAAGSATASQDYYASSGSLLYNPGVTSRSIVLSIVNDRLDESDETIVLNLTSAQNALLGSVTTHTYTIVNDDVSVPLGDAADAPDLTWSTSGDGAWFGEASLSHDGIDALESGQVGDGKSTTLSTTVTGPGTISFWWKVSSETAADFLLFKSGATQLAAISGEVGWQQKTFNIPAGSQTLQWVFARDASGGVLQNCGWVDQVVWTYNPPVPDIDVTPLSIDFGEQTITNNDPTTQTVTIQNRGTAPLSFTGAGVELTGADASQFLIVQAPAMTPLAPAESRTVILAFKPIVQGNKAAVLRITTDDPDQPTVEVALQGVGVVLSSVRNWTRYE
ncbi:MAG: C10 family peptidase [bacterium]|nr:C10 family peptidase [bacterium]